MIGKNIICKCPYCNKILRLNLSKINYYTYRYKTVIIVSHDNCGKFICEAISDDNIMSELRYNYPSRKFKWACYAKQRAIHYIDNDYSEENIITNTIDDIRNNFDNDIVNKDINDIKTFIQIILGTNNLPKPWSIQLTPDVEKELSYQSTICW